MKKILLIIAVIFGAILTSGILSSCNRVSSPSLEITGEGSGYTSCKLDVGSAD